MVAREWYLRGLAADDPFDALSNFWRGFNSLYFPQAGGDERTKIRSHLQVNVDEPRAQQILERRREEVAYLLAAPVIDMRGNGRDTEANMAAFRASDCPRVKFEELFMVIYQVRCNFEHGQKAPQNDRDRTLCASAGPIVGDVITLSFQHG